jgi:hypothetical protein
VHISTYKCENVSAKNSTGVQSNVMRRIIQPRSESQENGENYITDGADGHNKMYKITEKTKR